MKKGDFNMKKIKGFSLIAMSLITTIFLTACRGENSSKNDKVKNVQNKEVKIITLHIYETQIICFTIIQPTL